ncbi:MAG: M20/M25/M40 family metallo-hydrolase [Gammaproteobacteria bacterium]
MLPFARFLVATVLCLPTAVLATEIPPELAEEAAGLRNVALAESDAYRLVYSLTTEVGPRLAGSEGDRAAVAWALTTLSELGFDDVRTQSVTVPAWERGEAEVQITAPFPQDLVAVALGLSVGTREGGIQAPVLRVTSLEALKELPENHVRGHIVFIDRRMPRTEDGSGYGELFHVRYDGPAEASRRGAVAAVIRSLGTSGDRFAHTGITHFPEGVRPIPALALAGPDADMLASQTATGQDVLMRVRSTARRLPDARSANVIAEIRGRERPDEVVLLGAHLDSWDLGTGAVDNGAGVAIVTEAARLIATLPRAPARTLRLVLFANEEAGGHGARAYAAAAAASEEKHVLALEADMGPFRIWRVESGVGPEGLPVVAGIAEILEPLGIAPGDNDSRGGADLGPLRKTGVPVLDFDHDATRYFDIHHTVNDTLDKVDPDDLRRCVAAYAVAAWVAANVPGDFGRYPERDRAPELEPGAEAIGSGRSR